MGWNERVERAYELVLPDVRLHLVFFDAVIWVLRFLLV